MSIKRVITLAPRSYDERITPLMESSKAIKEQTPPLRIINSER
jgi:hypothetical protein